MSGEPESNVYSGPWIERPVDAGGGGPHDGDMRERVARLEATVDTIRAEIRAGAAETREAVNTSAAALRADFQSLRTDTNKDVLGIKLWILGGVVATLIAILSYLFHLEDVVRLVGGTPVAVGHAVTTLGKV